MAIFTFKPILKSLIWGGDKIVAYKELTTKQAQVGESWEISGVSGEESIVADGKYAGLSLSELIKELKTELLGVSNYVRFGNEFPLLIKFIDAQQDLSIQVHPDDELSAKRHNKKGKTEMWYVVGADLGAKLRSGFSQAITPEEYEQRIVDNTITEVLQEYDVNAGDLFFLPAGRIHSIGAGCFIAEIQQTSDVTYRIYDFDRIGADGQKRELHTELSKDAIDYKLYDDYKGHYKQRQNQAIELASCPYFSTQLYDLDIDTTCDFSMLDSFIVVMCVEGIISMSDNEGNTILLHQGNTALVSASTKFLHLSPTSTARLLMSYIPTEHSQTTNTFQQSVFIRYAPSVS